MSCSGPTGQDIDRFINENIDTVPQLEALLLLWESRPREWSDSELAARLFKSLEATRAILADLAEQALVASSQSGSYHYDSPGAAADELMEAVAAGYRRELVRITQMIHAKGPKAVREFARAFEFKKKKE